MPEPRTRFWGNWRRIGLISPLVLYGVLLVPMPESGPASGPTARAFRWNQDSFWNSLESQYREARRRGCEGLADEPAAKLNRLRKRVEEVETQAWEADDSRLAELEVDLFQLAPAVAVCEQSISNYVHWATRAREAVKAQSRHWDLESAAVRSRLYRLLYGSRAAIEEVLLQRTGAVEAAAAHKKEPTRSPTAAAELLGVRLRSGDILVSRGGAATSALIARGNDYPGNFSHVALLHVDPGTGATSVIEAHIERGVTMGSLEQYLADKKLRILVLRLREDLPAMRADPSLPQRAASWARDQALARHIPYDFAMDYRQHEAMFCSEVASAAYESVRIQLWMGISTISTPGLKSWLWAFGVRQFQTQEPSDLEYDPQLRLVAEWRDPAALYADHLDNAVMDALLEEAEAGARLGYPPAMLPLARAAKAISALMNSLGGVGPVPEGMSAATALRHRSFVRRHAAVRRRVERAAAEFQRRAGYRPPYWELIRLSREARDQKG